MANKQYIIENRDCPGNWLCRIDKQKGRCANDSQTNTYGPHVENAIVFRRKDLAVRFAKRWGGKVWLVKDGKIAESVAIE